MKARTGAVFVELLVTLAMGALTVAALGSVLLTHLEVARTIAARVAITDAVRLVLHVMPAELRLMAPLADLHGFAPESIAVRLPRLSGVICAAAPGRVWVQASGLREPDASKDSMLVLSAAGEAVLPVTGATAETGPCPRVPGRQQYRIDTSGASPAAGAVIVFESGTYYLRDGAFRFRLGREGRQPLTGEVFQDGSSQFGLSRDPARASFSIRLAPRPGPGAPSAPPAWIDTQLLNADGGP